MNKHKPNLNNIYSLIGFGLTHIQEVERIIKFTTTYILQKDSPLTLEKLERLNENERKYTLGKYFGKVRDSVDLHPQLDELLNKYLQDRNDFVHNQENISGWNLETEDGISKASLFICNMIKDGNVIMEIFIALTSNWVDQIELSVPTNKEQKLYLSQIKDRYEHHLEILFKAKL